MAYRHFCCYVAAGDGSVGAVWHAYNPLLLSYPVKILIITTLPTAG